MSIQDIILIYFFTYKQLFAAIKKIKASFVSNEGSKARTNKTGINFMILF